MMLPSWANDSVTVVEPAWVDERGKRVPDYETPTSQTLVLRCSVQPGGGSEDRQGRQNVTIRHTAFVPADVQVTAHSRVLYDGTPYAVDGPPEVWRSPTGAASHTAIRLVDWEG